ncbi:jmjC domain-containing histone demethylation protein 1 [Frankliniella occidentalis]|uniref:[histone H3]-dimethyl-L-lysine(36) demethylase n=1 Tax=Frankliniella occidentalis TaxID=133901 RepID=A0A9C6UEF0_FRAOC|nr:jmjC domain-containing histone demethylation protein 1 [Frankliniella occidentalis]
MSERDKSKRGGERRQLRDRKPKLYTDDWAIADEEIEGGRLFQLDDKLESDRYEQNFVKEMNGKDFTVQYIQRHGFSTPVLFKEKSGLGMVVPSKNFSINDVRTCVGSKRMLDVMDVNTQKNCEMSMKEWQRYYEDPDKDKLLNVISLEFSHTKLENYVKSPSIVRQIDWVDVVWPRHLKLQQQETTNAIDEMMYPKVQKYCLMSVKGCYTDFHVDFGGTSVWYHIVKGSKVFWLIPPTERNLNLYEQWVLSGKQGDVFFGDMVDKCGRVRLNEGNTFFIPSGWIHAVYTPLDSLVFGGNFLHAFSIEKQLRIAQVEDTTHVPQKFRYPFFTELLWYVLERYVHCVLGRSHLDPDILDGYQHPMAVSDEHLHLTPQELYGLKAIVMYLHSLPINKKNVPELVQDPIQLIRDVKTLVEKHRHDSPEKAVTGRAVLRLPQHDRKDSSRGHSSSGYSRSSMPPPMARSSHSSNGYSDDEGPSRPSKAPKLSRPLPPPSTSALSAQQSSREGPRRRRTRCKRCEACQRSDCGECTFCQDMVKFGGLGRAKQTCVMRQCLQPMLPVTASCAECCLDGWGQRPVIPVQKNHRDSPSSLMECSVCYEIAHPECVRKKFPDYEGVVNEDLPNSWECPRCCQEGKNVEYKPRHFRARQKSSDFRRMSYGSEGSSMYDSKKDKRDMDSDDSDDEFSRPSTPQHDLPSKRSKLEPKVEPKHEPLDTGDSDSQSSDNVDIKPKMSPHSSVDSPATPPSPSSSINMDPRKRAVLLHQAKAMKKSGYVVRPNPGAKPNPSKDSPSPKTIVNLAMEKSVILPVMEYLTPREKVECGLVCKSWAQFSLDPSLWKRMTMAAQTLTAGHLSAIVRRQPEALVLDWTGIGKRQLAWLIMRLPQLRELSLQGVNVLGVQALRTCMCPPLSFLDISFAGGLNDATLREILSAPPDSRPGLVDTKSRLRNLRTLKLAGSGITDVALRYITQHLPRLSVLDLSSCTRLTDAGVAQLTTPPASSIELLQSLDVSNCPRITDASLDHLVRCAQLGRLDLRHSPLVTAQAVQKFVSRSKLNLRILDGKLVLHASR